ncbi:L-serine ammonia-lyase [Brevundimonas sp. Root1279]|uniref:L-serine ammonia-lyase n=1 Tax=Brevundimonas sp. Root1279 TaxID=1736443 RepID=UPI0007005846|nr:L-serine ammonia-lyase [Brevundimonas sp. Root1279]KQW83698.1 serine dehydratase [Brevundimonas sp. Root1279]
MRSSRDSGPIVPELDFTDPPPGSDRRAFMVRSAMAVSIGALTGAVPKDVSAIPVRSPRQDATPPLDPSLDVVKRSKGPVMTTVDEFYKVGPGPSSSHTIGPMRITYDFYKRAAALPADQLAQADALKVHLYGSLSATGKGHGTERAALAGLIGMEPATVDPAFLDGLAANPNQTFPVTFGEKTVNVSLNDVIYDATQGEFPHPNTMTAKLMAGDRVLLEQEYYSVGGGFIEWKGYEPPPKNAPKYPYEKISEAIAHCTRDNISLAQMAMANETTISGRSEEEINAFLDKILGAMDATVKTGLAAPTSTLPGPIRLKTKAHDVYENAKNQEGTARKAIGLVSAYALAGSEENARGHLVITAPTGGSAGVLPAVIYSLGPDGAQLPKEKLREALLAGAVVGYLCKHNATLAAAEGGCQAEIGVASAMGAAGIAQAYGEPPQVAANAAEGALEHHLGMTCDPVAGFVQVPCIERCAFGAVKAWTGYLIAANEVPINRRVDFDSTVEAMALTARDMNPKYKETSEGGLALSVTLC